MTADTQVQVTCRGCGRVDTDFTLVSEHRVAKGTIAYVRCTCGALQIHSRSRLADSQPVLGAAPRAAA